MARVQIIHTGGTIGMVRGDNGFRPEAGILESVAHDMFCARNISVKIQLITPLIDSANATPSDWNRIAEAIVAAAGNSEAVIVTHGTDTMGFAAAALTMALEGLPVPVVLTGAMVPLSEPESDGMANLNGALDAALSAEPGVWVAFAGRVMHGARVRKRHSFDLDAFEAGPTDHPPCREGDVLRAHAFGQAEVAVVPVAPGGSTAPIRVAMEEADGVILRVFGSGTVPSDPAIEAALVRAAERGIPVVAISETLFGGTRLGAYAASAPLVRNGVIDGRDMMLEAAYAKLHLALASVEGLPAIKRFIETPLAGEFNAGRLGA